VHDYSSHLIKDTTTLLAVPQCTMEPDAYDYGEWDKKHFLVVVDAFSKWPEVRHVSSTLLSIPLRFFKTYLLHTVSQGCLCLTMGHSS